MTVHDEPDKLHELGVLTKLADGGQGTVYRMSLRPGELYKSYHAPDQLNVGELKRLIRTVQSEPMRESDRALILESTAWPTGTVLENGVYKGLTMPEAPERFTADIGGRRKLRELQFLIFAAKPMWSDLALPAPEQRRKLVQCFAKLFRALHDADIVIGDVSPRNLLWALEPEPSVYSLDCDGFRINGFASPMPQAQTPDWVDPAQEIGVATLEGDRYKLALLILRVLLTEPKITPGEVAADPVRLERLGERVAALAVRVADGERCSAAEWARALDNRPTIQFDQVKPPAPRKRPGPPQGPGRPVIRFD
jgi:DNA-binding helix-hairpin-helix protein with protein kinase domain